MALSPHAEDKNRDQVKARISKLEKQNSAQAKDSLKQEFNIDADGKSKVQPAQSGSAKSNA